MFFSTISLSLSLSVSPLANAPPKKALDEGFDHAVAELARRGVSNSLRPKVWSRILCPLSFGDELVVEPLLADVCRHDLLADKLILCDIATLCNYDDNYFVFEVGGVDKNTRRRFHSLCPRTLPILSQDLMKSVLLCFARDSAVAERLPSPRCVLHPAHPRCSHPHPA